VGAPMTSAVRAAMLRSFFIWLPRRVGLGVGVMSDEGPRDRISHASLWHR
jgi:hypothetical protein